MKYTMLSESIDYKEIKSQPYFDKFKKLRLYHGMKSELDEPTLIPFRYRNKSVDTPVEFHEAINEVSTEKFGVPIRNLKFLYGSARNVDAYGSPHIIIPKGDFQLFTNPDTYDMTVEYNLDVRHSRIYRNLFTSIVSNLKESITHYLLDNQDDEDDEEPEVTIDDALEFKLDKLLERFKPNISKYYNGDIRTMFTNYIIDNIDDIVDDSMFKFIESNIGRIVNGTVALGIKNFAISYVDGIIEVQSDSDISSSDSEFMLYAPEGMYVIPENTKLWHSLYG